MRKITLSIFMALGFLLASSTAVLAVCQCVKWETTSWQCCTWRTKNGKLVYVCGTCSKSTCAQQQCTSVTCGPGYYNCNRGCCAIAVPTPTPVPNDPPVCNNAAPAAPTLSSPADLYNATNTTVGLLWSAPSGWGTACSSAANTYRVYVGTDNPPTTLVLTTTSATTSFNFSGTFGTTYYWRVLASNGQLSTYSAVRSFNIVNAVIGTVYYDPTNICSTSTPWSKGAGMSLTLRDTPNSSAVTNGGSLTGQFGISAPVGSYQYLDLAGIPTGYACSSAPGCNTCQTHVNVTSPSSGNNFFITDKPESWWQTQGAGIYAGGLGGGVTVRSILPDATQHLIEPGVGGTLATLMRSSGSVNIGSGTVSTSGYSTQTHYKGKKMNYEYFAARVGVLKGQSSDWQSDALDLPAYQADKGYWYIKPVSGTATVASPWNVGVGEKYVIFVDGDLRIKDNIQVPVGGYLMFIVSGKVTIDPNVATLQGIYLMDGNFVTNSAYVMGLVDDVQLNVQGIVIAWGALSLNRDMGISNKLAPAEKFTYRTDLLTNTPDNIKAFATEWQEVVAGTITN